MELIKVQKYNNTKNEITSKLQLKLFLLNIEYQTSHQLSFSTHLYRHHTDLGICHSL